MAISTTTINGTDSVAASRITLNDNFNTIKDALNNVLSIIDIATGKINNFGYGSNNDMETEDIVIRGSGANGGVFVLSGSVNVNNGNVIVGGTASNGFIQVGAGTNAIYLERIQRTTSGGTIPTVNLSGATAGATASTSVGYVTLPRLTPAQVVAIQNPTVGSMVYSIGSSYGNGTLLVCTATGATGTWKPVTLGAAIV